MPACPECKKDIRSLNSTVRELREYLFVNIGGGFFEHDTEIEVLDFEPLRFRCPECNAMLFEDRDAAEAFLGQDLVRCILCDQTVYKDERDEHAREHIDCFQNQCCDPDRDFVAVH